MQVVQKKDLTFNYSYADLEKKRKKELGKWMWIVLIGCLLFQMFPYCVALNLNNVFSGSDWTVWLGGDATYISLTFTIGSIGAAISGPFIAKAFGKPNLNMRVTYIIGVVACTLGFIAFGINAIITKANNEIVSQGTAITILYVFTLISQVGVMIFSGLGVNNLISKWWPAEKRGVALGIAFAGGSLGNIWLQQVVAALSKVFGNELLKPTTENPGNVLGGHMYYDVQGDQYATYLILGVMGLIVGVLVALVICRKPLPSISILDDKKLNNVANQAKVAAQEVTPLSTKKYPVYWIFCVGYMILQMGTVHAAMNGVMIQNSTALHGSQPYTDIMATGGTLFGVGCLIGNVGGGIVNDKLGPSKSIFLAGLIQSICILLLMLSVKTQALVYVYFVLAGLSVYVYTSTPAYTCGRLFGPGQSNNHMAILGMFVALGFAITNSISGALIGDVASIQGEMFGEVTHGNIATLGWFALACMLVGTVVVSICCGIMQGKGIKGLLEYSPTKYTRVMMKHNLGIKFGAKRILLTKKDYRNNEKYLDKVAKKQSTDQYYHAYSEFQKAISLELKGSKLTSQQLTILGRVYFQTMINAKLLADFLNDDANIAKIKADLETLTKKGLLEKFDLGMIDTFYTLDTKLANKLASTTTSLWAKYPLINKENDALVQKLTKIDNKEQAKMVKLSQNLEKANNIVIDANKQLSNENKVNAKLAKLADKKAKILEKCKSKDSWVKYQHEYDILEKIFLAEDQKNKYQVQKQNKIMEAQKKIGVSKYVFNFSRDQQIEGHDLLVNYYNDKINVCNELMSEKVTDILDRKLAGLNVKTNKLQAKVDKINSTLIKY